MFQTSVLYNIDNDCASLPVISWLYTGQVDPKPCYPLGFFGACVTIYDSDGCDRYAFDVLRNIRYTIEDVLKSYHINQEGKEADVDEVIVKSQQLPRALRESILRPYVNEYVTQLIERFSEGQIHEGSPFPAVFDLINDMIPWQSDTIEDQDVRNVLELIKITSTQTTSGPGQHPRCPFFSAFRFMLDMIDSQGEVNKAQNARMVLQLTNVFASQTPSHPVDQEREAVTSQSGVIENDVGGATKGMHDMAMDEDCGRVKSLIGWAHLGDWQAIVRRFDRNCIQTGTAEAVEGFAL